MSVGYRSFLHADPGQHLLDVLIEHLNRWMAGKALRVDADTPGRYSLDNDNVVTVLDEECGSGRVYRWTRYHPHALPREVLRTTLTAYEHPNSGGWLWSEIETRDEAHSSIPTPFSCMSVPRVLRTLLGTLSLRDGRTELAPEPLWVSPHHLPDVMDHLADETRLGSIYVASQDSIDGHRFEQWVAEVSWHLISLGSVLMLDTAATAEFNDMVGELHAVPAGTIRTYLPGVNLDDAEDPRRHRILGTTRIRLTEPRRLAGMLGLIARVRAAQLGLPAELIELDQHLLAREELAPSVTSSAELHAVPTARGGTEDAILAKLDSLEREIRSLRTALDAQQEDRPRQLSAS